MTDKGDRLPDYLRHIEEAARRIAAYVDGVTREHFVRDQMLQDAIIRNLEIIGEASRNITRVNPGFAARHPDLPLKSAYEMRNVLAHGYFGVDLDIVWRTIVADLPAFARQVSAIEQTIAGESGPAEE